MQALILVGGFGTRLQSVLPGLPKPMAPINEKPFLAYLLQNLQREGIQEVFLAVHYQAQAIKDYFGDQLGELRLHYIQEESPLGTGGAIVHALQHIQPKQPIFVLNGDTFVNLNYQKMYQQHLATKSKLTFAVRKVSSCLRYGRVIVQGQQAIAFAEKGYEGPGWINAGIYLVNPLLFADYDLPRHFSIETDFLFPYIARIQPQVYEVDSYFIDIGIPEDYAKACQELPQNFYSDARS